MFNFLKKNQAQQVVEVGAGSNKFLSNSLMVLGLFGVIVVNPGFMNWLFAAPGDDTLIIVICRSIQFIKGPIGMFVSVGALIAMGMGVLSGKITWTSAVLVAAGIGTIWSATTIAAFLTDNDQFEQCGDTPDYGDTGTTGGGTGGTGGTNP